MTGFEVGQAVVKIDFLVLHPLQTSEEAEAREGFVALARVTSKDVVECVHVNSIKISGLQELCDYIAYYSGRIRLQAYYVCPL